MWWEILPSAGVVFLGLLAPHGIFWAVNKVFHNGKNTARNWYAQESHIPDYNIYLRDIRITGSEYIPQGLEAIPNEDCP
uniref:Complex I-MWFE n=1 Tax=Arion vulgaris TaxID=1028688 RepID=A0A0B7AP55_9EUPU